MAVIEARPYGVAYAPLGALEGVEVVANEALAAPDQAEDARAAHRCDGATGAVVERAALARLAAASRESGAVDPAGLERLFAFAFDCANAAGDREAARRWVERLRASGVPERPELVAYPEIDATSNAQPVKLHVDDAAGGIVSVDLRAVGRAPIDILVDPGRHWIVASGIAVAHDVTNRPLAQRLTLPGAILDDAAKTRESLRDRVHAWRLGGPRDANSIAEVMRDAGLVLTVVLVPAGDAEVWKLEADGSARRTAKVAQAAPGPLARAVRNAAGRL